MIPLKDHPTTCVQPRDLTQIYAMFYMPLIQETLHMRSYMSPGLLPTRIYPHKYVQTSAFIAGPRPAWPC